MKNIIIPLMILGVFNGCIGDDIILDEVPVAVRILNQLDTIAVGDTFQFEAIYTNNIGAEEEQNIIWTSSDTSIVAIGENGLATALIKGTTEITASVELDGTHKVMDQFTLVVDQETVLATTEKSGVLKTTSSYQLNGSFSIRENNGKLIISFSEDYSASTALPGLYIYLGNNASSISSAYEIGAVQVFNGAHTYEVENIGINEFQYLLYWCKPFNVKVGEGVIE